MSTWKEIEFFKLLVDESISYGIVQPGAHTEINSIPILRVNNIKNGYIKTDDVLMVDALIEKKYKRTRLNGGELLITVVGSVGECAIVPNFLKGWNVARAVSVAKIKNDYDARFIKYAFKTDDIIFQMYGNTNDTVQPTLNLSSLKSLKFKVPSYHEQTAIASVLSSLDDKIDLLHRQNATLEKMAETLFRQWFVEREGLNYDLHDSYDYRDLKNQSNQANQKDHSSDNVEEAKDLWESDKLGNVFDIGIGRTPPRKEQHWFSEIPSDLKWVSIKDMGTSGVYIFNTSEYLTQDAVDRFCIPIIPENTVMLSFKMTIGRLAISSEKMLSNEAIAHFKVKKDSKLFTEFLYLYLKTFQWEQLGSTSSIVEAINSQMIKEMQIIIPDAKSLTTFKKVVEPYFNKIKSNQNQIRTLTALRDTLLPKLMSGEVRVSEL